MVGKRHCISVYFDDFVLVLDDLVPHKLMIHKIEGRSSIDTIKQTVGPGTPTQISRELPLTRAVQTFVTSIQGDIDELLGLDWV